MRSGLLATALLVGASLVLHASVAMAQATPPAAASSEEQDSYTIYSLLLNAIPEQDQPLRTWMFQDVTWSLPADHPCVPAEPPSPETLLEGNAHLDIHPPEDQMKRFKELLDDFDQHCHESFHLRAKQFNTARPVRILTEKQAANFSEDLAEGEPKTIERHWPGAGGLRTFSRVFFNADHTVAMVHESVYCGTLCGTYQWDILERTPNGWRVLHWNRLETTS